MDFSKKSAIGLPTEETVTQNSRRNSKLTVVARDSASSEFQNSSGLWRTRDSAYSDAL